MSKRDTLVRIPNDLVQQIQQLAEKKQSTVPRQVEYLIRKALESETEKS